MSTYTHLELNQDVSTPSGYYTPQKEVRLDFNGHSVLYTVTGACIEASCCGKGDYCSALVPGYIKNWRFRNNENGLPVSEVEPITDESARDAIRRIIKDNEHVNLTEFW
jgi:hypothetical protein